MRAICDAALKGHRYRTMAVTSTCDSQPSDTAFLVRGKTYSVAHTEPRTTAVPLLIEKDQMDLDQESAKKLIARIGDAFDELPAELKKAARYVTSNPSE